MPGFTHLLIYSPTHYSLTLKLLQSHREDLKNDPIMVENVIRNLINQGVKDSIENTIRKSKNTIFSNRIKNYVGMPLWLISLYVPSQLRSYRANGNKFFSLPSIRELKKIDMLSFDLVFILATVIAFWNQSISVHSFVAPLLNQLAESHAMQLQLKKEQKLAVAFNDLIDCIQKIEGGAEKLVEAGLSKIAVKVILQHKSIEDIVEYVISKPAMGFS